VIEKVASPNTALHSAVAEMGHRLATIHRGQKVVGAVPLFGG